MRFLFGAMLLVVGLPLWGQAADEPKPRRKPALAVEVENPAAAPAKAPARWPRSPSKKAWLSRTTRWDPRTCCR